jgi:hypothetical protein
MGLNTNRDDVENQVRAGGWAVAFGRAIAYEDAARGGRIRPAAGGDGAARRSDRPSPQRAPDLSGSSRKAGESTNCQLPPWFHGPRMSRPASPSPVESLKY